MVSLIRTFLVMHIFCIFFSKISVAQESVKYYIEERGEIYRGAIEIKLETGWHTYWKHPGINGFKPKFSILSKENVRELNFFWPPPKILGPDGYEYLGYDKSTFIPFKINKLDKNKFSKLKIEMNYGVCKKICLVKNRVLKIDPYVKTSFSDSKKINIAFKRIPSEFNTFSENKCILKSSAENFIDITLKNEILKDKKNISLALIDYKDQNSLITDQSFNSKEGSTSAVLFSEQVSLADIDLNKLILIFSVDGSAKKINGCKS